MKTSIILLFACLFLVSCVAQDAAPSEIVIGSIQDLTKQSASHGSNARDGIDLAVRHINEAGGINGVPLRVIHEDEQCDQKQAVSAANALIHRGVRVILGPTCSSSAMAIAPIAEEAHVIMLASIPSTPHLRNAGDYVFRNRIPGDADGKKMAEFAYNTLGAQTAGVIYINLDNGIGYRDAFVKRFEELGGHVINPQSIELDQADFRTELLKVEVENPDVIFIASQTGHLVVKQARQLGIETQLIGPITMESRDMLEVAREAAEGIYYSHPAFDPESEDTAVRQYQEAYRQAYGKQSEIRAAESYDATMLIAHALRACDTDTTCIKDYLYNIEEYTGASGTTTFDAYGEVSKPLIIKTVKDGAFVPYLSRP